MRTALVIGGRPDYAGPAVRILPRTGARVYLSERWKVDDLINKNDRQQQLISLCIQLTAGKTKDEKQPHEQPNAKTRGASAACMTSQRDRRRDKTTTTQQGRRRMHRSNKVEARATTTRANRHERDGPLTWCSLYCTAFLLIQLTVQTLS